MNLNDCMLSGRMNGLAYKRTNKVIDAVPLSEALQRSIFVF